MKRFYMINYLLCGICLLWMTGCSNMLDEMRPKWTRYSRRIERVLT